MSYLPIMIFLNFNPFWQYKDIIFSLPKYPYDKRNSMKKCIKIIYLQTYIYKYKRISGYVL